LLIETIVGLRNGTLAPTPQDHARATLAPMLKKEDGMLVWDGEATALANRVRGLTPWPGAYTFYGNDRWRIWRAQAAPITCSEAQPGTIVAASQEAIRVATSKGSLLIQEIQSAAGKRLAVRHYLAGHAVTVGTVLTSTPTPIR
jgi:methionyl-tRNA formyltransferase